MEFSNPSIFSYLILLAIPIIIHLFNFRKYKKIDFSSIHLLSQIEKTTKSKSKLRQWIILISRLGIITLIICAFALPYINTNSHQQESSKIGMYIDNSFSMNRIDSEKTKLLDYAKSNAKQIIQELKPKQKVLILTNDLEKKHQKWYAPKDAISLIDSIKISGKPSNIDIIAHKYNQNIDTTHFNSFYLFSDFQKINNVVIPTMPTKTSIKIGHLTTKYNNINISIDSCYFNNPMRKKNEIENLTILLTNHGEENITTKTDLIINNQQKSTYNIEIPANSTTTHNLHYINPNETEFVNGLIKINDQNLTFDNQLYFSYSTRPKIPVVVIYQDNLSDYLMKVFSDSIFDFKAYNYNQIDYNKLEENQLIILDQISEITSSLSAQLKQYAEQGNNILIFPNQTINIPSYNKFLTSINVDLISKWIFEENNIEYINYENTIFKSVFNEKNRNINLPKVKGRFSIKKNKRAQSREILSFLDNSPFLKQYVYNTGNIFMCFSNLNSENNNFSQHALFIPVLYNAALTNSNAQKLYTIIKNETIIEKNDIKKDDEVILKKDLTFNMTPKIQHNKQKTLVNFNDAIYNDGNYQLIVNRQDYTPISFNYSRDESKMEFLTTTQIEKLFSPATSFILKNQNTITKKFGENKKSNQIEYFFIISAIILLIIELILLRTWKT